MSDLQGKEFVFKNRQRIGDILMFTCAVRDFKRAFPDVRVNVISTAAHIWDHNPNVDRTLVAMLGKVINIGPGKLTNASNRVDWHFANAFRISIQDALGIKFNQGESRPDIYLTQEEYDAPRVIKEPYWIIVLNGEKGWGCKMYPFTRWQEFVNQNKGTTFVQVGTKEDNAPRLQGDNVIDYIGKTQSRDQGIRDLYKLFLNAEGSIGLVSFHMHLSGALYKPCIVVAGAREPVSFTRYQGHRYLNTEGCLPCSTTTACWKCDIDACRDLRIINDEKVPRCVDMIEPEDITRALDQYYIGGRLHKGKVSAKPKMFKNIVKTPVKVEDKNDPAQFGLEWGGGCITSNDWQFMEAVVHEYKIKSVLEFGSGLSTLLFNKAGLEVLTYETNPGWVIKLKKINPDIDIRLWDGKMLPQKPINFDLAFVDGPAGGQSREYSTVMGAQAARVVIVHDANREFERKWQTRHVEPNFDGPTKGGNRCHLWIKNLKKPQEQSKAVLSQTTPQEPPSPKIPPKSIKIVSTARGWGGCARSVTTIMKHLLRQGHDVEFIPFRNKVSSREFKECIDRDLKGLKVTEDYSTVKEPCDILFMYADDFVWEFEKEDIVKTFTGLKAEKTIMMINYRKGKIGTIPWTQGWDKYMFLNSTQEEGLLKVLPGMNTKVLAPCTELEPFFVIKPNYNTNLRIVRHSSQGNTKYAKNFQDECQNIFDAREDAEINLMPAPDFIDDNLRLHKYPKNVPPVPQFLGKGNLFWYSLPQGYFDMGPRVILEAMACGLPVIADNWGGAKDRVTKETGWLCDSKEEHTEVITNVTLKELEQKGKAARERARTEFVPRKWLQEILA